jgi:predicted DNA binding CopG/RHH family protein
MAKDKTPNPGPSGRGRPGPRALEDLGDIELSPAQATRATEAIAQADKELAEARLSIRWGGAQLRTVQHAADLAGVPYQTYIKLVLFRQAVADIAAADVAGRDVTRAAAAKAADRKARATAP